MPDTSLYQQLKRLFSTNVIVRNIGGKNLKVIDPQSIQKLGLSGPADKYNRLYSKGGVSGWGYDTAVAFQAQRRMLFRDYDVMDNDPIINSALDIYSDESTVKDEMGNVIQITSENEKVKDVLHNLFYDILNIEFNLSSWVRQLCKYGDFFLELQISKGFGITNVRPISVYEINRVEGYDRTNPESVKFTVEGGIREQGGKRELENFQVAHFRLISDTNYLPYGKSMIEGARRTWKQLALMEDAMLIHRIMRAPEKRVFKVDVGNIPPHEVDTFMQSIISKIKKTPFIDPNTGDYNLKYNIQNLTEDFYLPVRGGDSGTNIENLPGLEYNSTEDIEYIRDKMMSGLKVPRAFLNYEDQIGSKATLAAEDVRFARTIERIQRIVVSELWKMAIVHLYVQGFKDEDLALFNIKLTNPSTIYEQEKIELWNSKIALARDIQDTKLLSTKWIYTNLFEMATTEVTETRKEIVKDLKRSFRHGQIEGDGNDPAESGQVVGDNGQLDDLDPGAGGDQNGLSDQNDQFGESIKKLIPSDKSSTKKVCRSLNFDDLEEMESSDGRRGSRLRTRYKDDPFGDDPLGAKEYHKMCKLDKSLNNGRKFKGNSPLATTGVSTRRMKEIRRKLGAYTTTSKMLHEGVDNKTKKYFLDEQNILNIKDK